MTNLAERTATGQAAARKAMIDSQLRTSGVNADFVLRRMSAVPRENFVPEGSRGIAYMDRAIALPGGGHLASPLVQGMMLQEAAPRMSDRALLVDGGSGYLAELLRPLVGSLEVLSPSEAFATSGESDITLLIVDGAVETIPESLTNRLADGARAMAGLIENGVTRLAQGRMAAGHLAMMPLAEIGMPVLPQFAAPKRWSF